MRTSERSAKWDNLKFILIVLVVLGHSLEPFLGILTCKILYIIIYCVHMPLYAFVSGYFATFNPRRIICHVIYPYVVFQMLYIIFNNYILHNEVKCQFTTPHWLLWYLFAFGVWQIMIAFIRWKNLGSDIMMIICFLALGLLVGFDSSVGYYMSLSRIIVLFPFFLVGNYVNAHQKDLKKIAEKPRLFFLCSLIGVLIVTGVIILFANKIQVTWFYHSVPYSQLEGYSVIIRLLSYITAAIFGIFLYTIAPSKKKCFTFIGENCFVIYLLHGFFIEFANKNVCGKLRGNSQIFLYVVLIAVIIVLLLGNKWTKRIFNKLFILELN